MIEDAKLSTFIGFSSILTVFCALTVVLFYLLARIHITGFTAFCVVYVIWIFVIAVMTLTGGDE